MWYCQWGLRIMVFWSRHRAMGSPNTCRSWNWFSCLVSPCCHSFSHVVYFFSFWQVKKPRTCSSEVVADNLIASMVNLRRLLGRDSVLNDELWCWSLDIALRDWRSKVGTDISMSSSVWHRWLNLGMKVIEVCHLVSSSIHKFVAFHNGFVLIPLGIGCKESTFVDAFANVESFKFG